MSDLLDVNEIGEATSKPGVRFFKCQTAFDGNCLILSFNNCVGESVLTTKDLTSRLASDRATDKRVPIPGKQAKLLSFHLLVEAANTKRFRLSKIGGLRTSQEKFDFLLRAKEGRFLVLTNVTSVTQKRGTHDLSARNGQHWLAVSGDERLVIDSLARTLGPQRLTKQTLRRSTRAGVVKVYAVTRVQDLSASQSATLCES